MSANDSSGFYGEYVRRRQGDLAEDRIRKIVAALDAPINSVLDIGCGRGALLQIVKERFSPSRLVGVDVAPNTPQYMRELSMEGYAKDASSGLDFGDESFDAVICGEVIEHVIDTDRLVSEIKRVLKPNGIMILTTPNLAYFVNRFMLLAGLQPLFTETSLHQNLGRRWRFLGQGGSTQGHLKVFTLGALRELIEEAGFSEPKIEGYRFFQNGIRGFIDGIAARKPSLAAGFVVVARKR